MKRRTRKILCPQSSVGFGENKNKLKNADQAMFNSSVEKKAEVLVSWNTEERMFVDSGAFNAPAEPEGLKLR